MNLAHRLAAALLAVIGSASALGREAVPPLPAPLRAQVEDILRQGTVRGAAVVLVGPEGPIAAHWHGMADVARGVPVDDRTCFRAGSVSKTVAAVLARRLADQGRLALDAPLPVDLQPPPPPGAPGNAHCGALTVAQLLEHTGGVAGSSHAEYATNVSNMPVATRAADVARRPLRWCPGLHYSYANDGITLAAAALERAGGADFDTLVAREVFAPLRMDSATFATDPWPARLSRSYAADGSEIAQPWQLPMRAAGALIATPLDLARLVQMFLRDGQGDDGAILQAGSVARMAAATSGLAARQGAGSGAYGLGMFRFVAAGRLIQGHWGRIDGFQTTVGFITEPPLGMVIMVNTADRRTMHRLREAVAAHLGRDAPAAPIPPPGRPADGIAGWYANASHDMPLRAPWVGLFDVVRLAPDSTGVEIRPILPWGASRRAVAVTPYSFRDEALPLASMAFVPPNEDVGGRAWWIDGESYRRVAPSQAMGMLVLFAAGLLTSVVVVALVGTRGVLRWIRAPAVASAADAPGRWADRWLAISGASWLALFVVYALFGLFGSGDSLAAVGRPSAISLGLASASLIAPTATLTALWTLRKRTDVMRWGAALLLLGLAVLCAEQGWLPLVTWRTT
jgi:CubicO group peptidase (beta-lactamase class C family)